MKRSLSMKRILRWPFRLHWIGPWYWAIWPSMDFTEWGIGLDAYGYWCLDNRYLDLRIRLACLEVELSVGWHRYGQRSKSDI